MAHDDKDDLAPPPIVQMEAPATDQNEREWELFDAQEKSKALNPLFSNRIYAQPIGRNLRLSFGERIGEETVFHTSIVMPLEEALQTGDLLLRMANAGLSAQLQEFREIIADLDKPKAPEGGNG